MFIYYFFLSIPIFNIFFEIKNKQDNFLLVYLLLLVIFLGFRFELGTDWYEYSKDFYYQIDLFEKLKVEEFFKVKSILSFNLVSLVGNMPFYKIFLLISNLFSNNIIFFNLLNSIIVIFGIYYFCKKLNFENSSIWLIYLFLFPFLVYVSTDVVRQFTALTLVLISIAFLLESKIKLSLLFIFFGCLFHISSLIFFTIFFFYYKKFRISFMYLIIFIFSLYYFFYKKIFLANLLKFYLSEERLLDFSININFFIILFPIFFMITFLKSYQFSTREINLIRFFNIYGIFCLIISFLDDTTSYRLSIYLLIYYIFIIISLSNKLKNNVQFWFKNSFMFFSVISFILWANFSEHRHVYIPYKSVLFLDKEFENTKSQLCAKHPSECNFVQR